MTLRSRREIRLDDNHSIKLRVSKWFPEMILLTVVLASVGTYVFGNHMSSTTSIDTSNFFKKARKKDELVTKRHKIETVAARAGLATPKFIGAETMSKNFTVTIDAATRKGDTVTVVYQIHNKNKEGRPSSGTTWVSSETTEDLQNPERKVTWKAKYFTQKEASVTLKDSEVGEFKIHVTDGMTNTENTYTVRF